MTHVFVATISDGATHAMDFVKAIGIEKHHIVLCGLAAPLTKKGPTLHRGWHFHLTQR